MLGLWGQNLAVGQNYFDNLGHVRFERSALVIAFTGLWLKGRCLWVFGSFWAEVSPLGGLL